MNNLHTSFRVYTQFACDGNQPTTVPCSWTHAFPAGGLCCFRIMWKPSALTYSTWLSPVSFWKPSYNSDGRSIKTWIETRILKRDSLPRKSRGNVHKGTLPLSAECNLQRTNAWESRSFTTFWCELEWPVQCVAENNMRARNSRNLVNNNNNMGSSLRLVGRVA